MSGPSRAAPAHRPFLAAFADADAAVAAADRVHRDGHRLVDALTPFPVPALSDRLGASAGPLRPVMALAGFAAALLFFALQLYTQAYAYPLNSGGRPLASWPVSYLVPFETGVLAAALAGFAVFLWRCGLPRLHHPLFAMPTVARATQDHFVLLIEGPADAASVPRFREGLFALGAVAVEAVTP